MPNSVLESLVCGTPVIATEESGGIKEISGKGESNGITVTTNNKEFIKAMSKVKIKDKNTKLDSLLSEKYKKENVISNVERWINELD